jgi:hypothetical protein
MKYLKLFEEFIHEKSEIILEIGDASSKPFKWKATSNIKKEMSKAFDETMKLENHSRLELKDKFNYTFKNDDGVEYVVLFNGQMEKTIPSLNLTGKPLSTLSKYQSYFNLAYNTKSDHEKGIERNTNLGDHFRIMSTVTEISNDFLVQSEESGYPVKELYISAKGDEAGIDTLDSKRGRLYMAFIMKQMKNLKTKSDYYVSTYRQDNVDGVKLSMGRARGPSILYSKPYPD